MVLDTEPFNNNNFHKYSIGINRYNLIFHNREDINDFKRYSNFTVMIKFKTVNIKYLSYDTMRL